MRAERISPRQRLASVPQRTRASDAARQAHLLRLEQVHDLTNDACGCGGRLSSAATETRELLDVDPRTGWHLVRHHFVTRCCDSCGQSQQPVHPDTVGHGAAAFSVLAHVAFARYEQHQTLYHQAATMASRGLSVKRATLTSWIIHATNLLTPLAEHIRSEALRAPLIQAANAPVEQVQHSGARLWLYLARPAADSERRYAAMWFRFTPHRSGTQAVNELQGYGGTVQAAPHTGYDRLWTGGRIGQLSCWLAFLERLTEAYRHRPRPMDTHLLETIHALFAIENAATGLDPTRRMQVRRERSADALQAVRQALESVARQSPKTEMNEVAIEMIERWASLSAPLHDPAADLDNRAVEAILQPLVIPRRSWVFGGSRDAGKRAASVYTILETCKINGIDGAAYLAWVLPKLVAQQGAPLPAQLMPWNFRA